MILSKTILENTILKENKNLVNLFRGRFKIMADPYIRINPLNLFTKMYYILEMLSILFHQQWPREHHNQLKLQMKFLS